MDISICHSVEEFITLFKEYSKTTEDERKTKLLQERDYYHTANKFPQWVQESLESFKQQVIDMASATKPLKTTETFKVQAGYPHEVSVERKRMLREYGIKQDSNIERDEFLIPKLTAQDFLLMAKEENLLSISTPKDTEFIREIVMVDTNTSSTLIIFYVISRKARTISSWTIKKDKNKMFIPKINKFEGWKYRQP
tara:strand:- start:1752 stop:2339 length:588 start_codon:yes stop_codon:yes gene_type:complete